MFTIYLENVFLFSKQKKKEFNTNHSNSTCNLCRKTKKKICKLFWTKSHMPWPFIKFNNWFWNQDLLKWWWISVVYHSSCHTNIILKAYRFIFLKITHQNFKFLQVSCCPSLSWSIWFVINITWECKIENKTKFLLQKK